MSSTIQLPNAAQVAAQLKRFLRRGVEATASAAPPKGTFAFGGSFRGPDGVLLGHVLADLPFAAYASAAFALIPAEAASDAVRRKSLDDNLRETFAEVLNVASRLFLAREDMRVTLRETHLPPLASAPEILLAPKPLCLRVEIDGYGEGLFALALAA